MNECSAAVFMAGTLLIGREFEGAPVLNFAGLLGREEFALSGLVTEADLAQMHGGRGDSSARPLSVRFQKMPIAHACSHECGRLSGRQVISPDFEAEPAQVDTEEVRLLLLSERPFISRISLSL